MKALLDLLIPLAMPRPLILADQNGPRPEKPYYSLKVSLIGSAPLIETKPNKQGAAIYHEHGTLQCEVQCFGKDAAALLRQLGIKLRMPLTAIKAEQAGVSIASVDQARDLTALLQASQYEERAILEFRAHAIASVTDDVSLIEHVILNCPAEDGHQHVISSPDAATAPPNS
ncbi:hypothetical protein HMPREF9946_03142 [Acetobacteraceae bacterium AT-5844]|nr:hypothetical protein HMPREF9946_03142 [Acetobacteraceae bacterium AT-5844]